MPPFVTFLLALSVVNLTRKEMMEKLLGKVAEDKKEEFLKELREAHPVIQRIYCSDNHINPKCFDLCDHLEGILI